MGFKETTSLKGKINNTFFKGKVKHFEIWGFKSYFIRLKSIKSKSPNSYIFSTLSIWLNKQNKSLKN